MICGTPVATLSVWLQKKEDASELQQQSVALKKQAEEAEAAKDELERARDRALLPIGNLVHDSVPVDNDEVCRTSQLAFEPCPVQGSVQLDNVQVCTLQSSNSMLLSNSKAYTEVHLRELCG